MTRQGAVRGRMDGAGVASFLGIPYAAPPFGPRRFLAPAPPVPWDGVRKAQAHGRTVPKVPYAPPFDALIPEDLGSDGEDCLNLSVWTPEPGPNGGLPVMVWLHGALSRTDRGRRPPTTGERSPATVWSA